MKSDALIARVRRTVFLGDAAAAPEYTDDIILEELDDRLTGVFVDLVLKSRPTGYWLQRAIKLTTVGQMSYRVPPRAALQGLEKLECSGDAGSTFYKLKPLLIDEQQQYLDAAGSVGQNPLYYMLAADQAEITPAPSSVQPLKFSYYVTPSRLVLPQTSGFVTDISAIGARQVTVNALPKDMLAVGTPDIASGATVDIVHADGTHELALVGATATVGGLVLTLGGSDDLSRIIVGDAVRVAAQSEWPPLADEFHRCLADLAASKICVELGIAEKMTPQAIQDIREDLARFASAIKPRVKADPAYIPIYPKSRDVSYGPRRGFDWSF